MDLTQAQVREFFDYRDGNLYWRMKFSYRSRVRIGEPAGCLQKDGYRTISCGGRTYRAHRLIWLWHFGEFPELLDHVNGARSDNRIENLRPATCSQNNMNSAMRSDNTSGLKGVCFEKNRGKFRAEIRVRGRKIYLGRFADPAMAHAAYIEATKRLHGEFARPPAQSLPQPPVEGQPSDMGFKIVSAWLQQEGTVARGDHLYTMNRFADFVLAHAPQLPAVQQDSEACLSKMADFGQQNGLYPEFEKQGAAREPLTEEQAVACVAKVYPVVPRAREFWQVEHDDAVAIVREVEKAHGIGPSTQGVDHG